MEEKCCFDFFLIWQRKFKFIEIKLNVNLETGIPAGCSKERLNRFKRIAVMYIRKMANKRG